LPVRVSCEHLNGDDLFKVLNESEGSLVRQYKRAFKSYGITLRFEEESLKEIAHIAAREKTGARALMTVTERVLRDYKYELPSLPIKKFIVTKEIVDNPGEELHKLLNDKEYMDRLSWYEEIRSYGKAFRAKHNIKIDFTEAAVNKLVEICKDEGLTPATKLPDLLKGYEHGLSLIMQNSGKDNFVFDEEVIIHPQKVIEELIKASYSGK